MYSFFFLTILRAVLSGNRISSVFLRAVRKENAKTPVIPISPTSLVKLREYFSFSKTMTAAARVSRRLTGWTRCQLGDDNRLQWKPCSIDVSYPDVTATDSLSPHCNLNWSTHTTRHRWNCCGKTGCPHRDRFDIPTAYSHAELSAYFKSPVKPSLELADAVSWVTLR